MNRLPDVSFVTRSNYALSGYARCLPIFLVRPAIGHLSR